MTRKNDVRRPRRGYPPAQLDDHPLLRVLIAEATRRGDTLAAMAGALGVTYERVAQWRRKEANVSRASRGVLEAAAAYLDIPTAFVLCMVGILGIQDLLPLGRSSLEAHVKLELSRLRMRFGKACSCSGRSPGRFPGRFPGRPWRLRGSPVVSRRWYTPTVCSPRKS